MLIVGFNPNGDWCRPGKYVHYVGYPTDWSSDAAYGTVMFVKGGIALVSWYCTCPADMKIEKRVPVRDLAPGRRPKEPDPVMERIDNFMAEQAYLAALARMDD